MTTTQTLTPPQETNYEIKFPQGKFYSEEPPLESYLHLQQIIILLTSLEWLWREREDYFAAGNLTIYYSPKQKKSSDFRGPDFFVVLDTKKDETRTSWVVWEENGKYPHVIVEILSESTAKTDREEKKQIYQDVFRTPDYFWFDPVSLEFEGFTLVKGKYQPIQPNKNQWLYSEQLGLYLGIADRKLRYFTVNGELVPTPEEAAIQSEILAIQEKQKSLAAENMVIQERQKSKKLAQKLRELGINPDEIS
jgi:Uma2 family endonuclease